LNFRCDIECLKILKDWDDDDLAGRLKISARTLQRLKADPMSASGKNILMIQEMLRQERNRQTR
jgi:hypothetical protein